MESAASISSKKEDTPGLDFEYLRAQGIKAIQELTGAFWTDYNEHDPGVTILEQLCYALTDLSYRTNFDIQDHLFNSEKDDTFLKANQILPCNALTINDYRKLIFDSVFELKNVWFIPITSNTNSFRGLYKILLDANDNIKTEESKKQVLEKAKKVFCDNRTICEDVEEIKLLKPLNLDLHADVEIDGIREIEAILAEIFYRTSDYLSPEIKFYALQELLQEGYTFNEIFNGPLLKHGFIKTEEMLPKPGKILISEIIKIIMQVKGVVSVKNLYLKVGEKKFENQVEIGEAELPKLNTGLEQLKVNSGIQFFRGTVNYTTLDYKVVKRKFNELHSANKRVYRLSEENIKAPLGKKLNVENYFSLQNQFPVVYGIGQYGLPESVGSRRKAQAKQLKGFLLLFEQFLANYLSNLANVKTLFSLKQDVRQTYFYQSLSGFVPNVQPLLKEASNAFNTGNNFTDNPLSYQSGLPELVKSKDNYTDRRNRFLDYLLAIHGESYTQYSLSQFNYYFDEEEFERHLILNKTRLLISLSNINRNRARAFNYLETSLNTENITGMEAKIYLLLGFGVEHSEEVSNYKAHSLLDHFTEKGIALIQDTVSDERFDVWEKAGNLPEYLTDAFIDANFDFPDLEEVHFEDFSQEEVEKLLKNTLPFRSGVITTCFLSKGIVATNYQIGKKDFLGMEEKEVSANIATQVAGDEIESVEPGEKEQLDLDEDVTVSPSMNEAKNIRSEGIEDTYTVIFRASEDESWIKIGNFETESEGTVAVRELINTVKKLNIQSEGVHILEHILLRPDVEDINHGILINDEDYKPFLRSNKQYSFEEREKAIKEIKEHLYEFGNYSVEVTGEKDFEVHFSTPDGEYSFVSVRANESVEKTHEQMEKLFAFISNQRTIVPFNKKIGMYVKNTFSGRLMPEDFFSYRASVIIPDWTARFSNKEFRSIVEDTIHQEKPANVALNCYWLSPENLLRFESIYYAWMQEKQKPDFDKEKLDALNNRLSNLLLEFKDSCED